jgi:cell division protein FtsQ
MRLRRKLACAAITLLAAYAAWIGLLRNLPLFQVQNVTVSGLAGGAPQIASTLELTAREMTTTNYSVARLRSAVAGYTLVDTLRVHAAFPHGMRIQVIERRPLARLDVGGNIVAVSGDGSVLAGLIPSRKLPLLRSESAAVGGRVRDSLTREELALLSAAPSVLRHRVYTVTLGSEGLTVQLRNGPAIYFGDGSLPHAKWDSAAAVLANSTSRGASYINVSLPSRPAAQIDYPATTATGGTSAATTTLADSTQNAASSSTSG